MAQMSTQTTDPRELEALRRRKLALAQSGAGDVPDAAMPTLNPPPAPGPLVAHGGGVNLATGSNPALNNAIGGRSEAQIAQEARINATNLRGAYRAAITPEQKAGILADIHRHESVASAYEQGQNGYPVRAQSPDEVAAGRVNLNRQLVGAEEDRAGGPTQTPPIAFAPYNERAAQAGVERGQDRYASGQRTGREAIDIIREREMLDHKLGTAIPQAAIAGTEAQTAGSQAAIADAREKAAVSEQRAKIVAAQTGAMTGDGTTTGGQQGIIGQQMAAQQATVQGQTAEQMRAAAKSITGVEPDTMAQAAAPMLDRVHRRFGGFAGNFLPSGKVQYTFGGDLSEDIQNLQTLRRSAVDPLRQYAAHDKIGAKRAANAMLGRLPAPDSDGKYGADPTLPTGSDMTTYVNELNALREELLQLAQ